VSPVIKTDLILRNTSTALAVRAAHIVRLRPVVLAKPEPDEFEIIWEFWRITGSQYHSRGTPNILDLGLIE
jgi:hypothetical protein